MNAKLLTVLVGLVLLVPAGYAIHQSGAQRFGNCDNGSGQEHQGFSCEQDPQGSPFPPDAVTAHTVYASWVMERDVERFNFENDTLGLPTDFAAVAGFFLLEDRRRDVDVIARAIQRECVVWFNGMNLDQRPQGDNFEPENAFPSDEDQDPLPGGFPDHDQSYQDYDFDRDVPNCEPLFEEERRDVRIDIEIFGEYAVAVERGDCNPATGSDFRFRGHLDFVDPNGIYHEVQEYDYVCLFGGPLGRLNPLGPGLLPGGVTASVIKDFFPWTYTDPYNENGCEVYETPLDNADPAGGSLGFFDLGHKCNGSVQDLFTERLWITPIHAPEHDPTIDRLYTFALQIDTCAGINIYELDGKEAMGESNNYSNAENMPSGVGGTALGLYHEVAYHTYYSLGLDAFLGGWPLFDVCTDGSSFSFDDTPRGRVVHRGPPPGIGHEEILRGNSYDFEPGSETFGKHRTNCRVQDIQWPLNTYPPGPPEMDDKCYPEDHKTAQIDIWVFTFDPTGQFLLHSNGNTGPSPYTGPGTSTGPDGNPDV